MPAFDKEVAEAVELPSEAKIWKYMDLAKFLSLLCTGSLYFASPSRFQDPFEGSLPKSHVDAFSGMVQDHADSLQGMRPHFAARSPEALAQFDDAIDGFANALKGAQREATLRFGVNCWHQCEFESEAMWKLYSAAGQAVAIESTVRQLRASLGTAKGVIIAQVRYANFDNDPIETGHRHYGLFMKRKSFEHEKELRATILLPEEQWTRPETERGLSVPCDLDVLINRVHVSPFCETYVASAVRGLCSSEIRKLAAPVIHSKLFTDQTFNLRVEFRKDT